MNNNITNKRVYIFKSKGAKELLWKWRCLPYLDFIQGNTFPFVREKSTYVVIRVKDTTWNIPKDACNVIEDESN